MIPEPDDMMNFAATLEQTLDTKGWDQEALLALVLRVEAREMFDDVLPDPAMRADDDVFAVVDFPIQPSQVAPSIGDGMQMLAKFFNARAASPAPAALEKLCGLLMITEGWTNSIPRSQRDGRMLADIPGSQEIRTVLIIDCGGRVYIAERVRGHEPTVRQHPNPADYAGRLPQAMRDILLGIEAGRPGLMDATALRRVATYEEEHQ